MPLARALDHVFHRLRAAFHDEVAGGRNVADVLLLRPEPGSIQVFHHALLNPGRFRLRPAVAGPGGRGHLGVQRVGVDRDPLVEKLFAPLVAAALFAQERAAFVGVPGVQRVHQGADQAGVGVGDQGGRLQNHGVLARLNGLGVHRSRRLLERPPRRVCPYRTCWRRCSRPWRSPSPCRRPCARSRKTSRPVSRLVADKTLGVAPGLEAGPRLRGSRRR